jgi:hypothetical protein
MTASSPVVRIRRLGADRGQRLGDVDGARPGEDGADRGGDHFRSGFGYLGQDVAQVVVRLRLRKVAKRDR